MNPIAPVDQAFGAAATQRRAILATLASFFVELNRDPLDHSPLTEQLRVWHRDFLGALERYENTEFVKERYIPVLLNDIRMPEGPHRMLQPIVDFLRRNNILIPRQFERPSDDQIRAARIEAFRARQRRHLQPVPLPPVVVEPDPILVGRIAALQQGNQELAQRMEVVDARRRAEEEAIAQRIEQLNHQEIPEVAQRVDRLRENQREVDEDLVQVRGDLQQLDRDVEETKQALKEKQSDSLGGVLAAVGIITVCVAINAILPTSTTFTYDGKWANIFYRL